MKFGLRARIVGAVCAVLLLSAMSRIESPVADAAMRRDTEKVRQLLKQGADVNAPQGDGMTALHWAAEHADVALAEMLVYAGANVATVTRIGGYSPLHLAAKAGSAPVTRALLKAGSNPNGTTSTTGASPLHFAAASGSTEAVVVLLEHGADANARESVWGQTPLIFAAAHNRAAVITTLLQRGADASITTKAVNLTEEGALEAAATRRRNEVLAAFRPADRATGWTPTPTQVQAAIAAGRTVYTAQVVTDGQAATDDPAAIADGAVPGFAGQVGTMGGLTALHHAVRQGHMDAVRALLDSGVDINQLSAGDRVSPLLLATINGHFDVALHLIERGADPKLANTAGDTPLYATINTQWSPRSRFPQPQAVQHQKATYLEVLTALLKAGADPNVRIRRHLWYFAYNNCGNANCGLENLEGTTPFWRAAYAVDVEAMRLLVAHGADPKIPSQRAQGAAQRGGPGQRTAGAPGAQLQRGAGQQTAAGAQDSTRQGEGTQQQERTAVALQERPAAAQQVRAGAAQQERGAAQQGRGAAQQERGAAQQEPGVAQQERGAPPPAPGATPDSAAADRAAEQAAIASAPIGIGVYAIHAAAGVGYGNGFAANSHRHAPEGWMPTLKYLVEELGADVNARDPNGYTPLHHAAARGDNEMILYLVSKGADVTVVARNGRTTVDMANGPVQRLRPFPETIALLEKLGAKNNHRCVSC